MSNEFFHWTRWILDTCPLLDTCPNLAESSEKIHWTKALPNKIQTYLVKIKMPLGIPEVKKDVFGKWKINNAMGTLIEQLETALFYYVLLRNV